MGKRGPPKGRPVPHFVILAARQQAASDAAVLRAVAKHPGQGLRELARQTGLAVDTAKRALSRLETRGQVELHLNRRRLLVTLPGGSSRPALTQDEVALVKTVKLLGRPWQVDIMAAHGDVPRTTVQHRLGKLVQDGYLVAERVGPYVRYVAQKATH